MNLNVDFVDEFRVALNVLETAFGFSAHQRFDEARSLFCRLGAIGIGFIGNSNLKQCPRFAVHRGLAQLCGRHFAQAFEAADFDLCLAVEDGLHDFFPVGIVAGIGDRAAVAEAVERGKREEEIPTFYQARHLAVEKCHEKRRDVRTVNICVCHDDNALVTQFFWIEIAACPAAERLHKIRQFLIGRQLVRGRAGDV